MVRVSLQWIALNSGGCLAHGLGAGVTEKMLVRDRKKKRTKIQL
jgi:hypothetical protein